jgi:hypothetical protein
MKSSRNKIEGDAIYGVHLHRGLHFVIDVVGGNEFNENILTGSAPRTQFKKVFVF